MFCIMIKDAEFSDCGKYRYLLTRIWDDKKPYAMCIGLNPSNADSEKDDPTIRNLCAHLNKLGFGGLKMCNLYALISPKPDILFSVPDPLKNNDLWIESTAHTVQEIIFCWGSFKNIEYRAKQMINLFPSAKCFGRNKNGAPWHPLAMMYLGIRAGKSKLVNY